MNSQVRTVVLAVSLVSNVILAAGLAWSRHLADRAVRDAMASAAESAAQLQEEVLADLRSGDAGRAAAAQVKLEISLDANRRISYKARTTQGRPGP